MPSWPQLAELGAQSGGHLHIVPLDVGSTESVRKAAEMVTEVCRELQACGLDILVNCAGIAGGDGTTVQQLERAVNVNAVGALRMTECFLPLMEKGRKRLCYISSEAGCISLAHRDGGYPYCASKIALNMAVKLMFNELRPEGYTFRLYHPGWVNTYMSGEKSNRGRFEAEETAAAAFLQFTSDREWEDVLVMTDVKGESWPF